MKEIYCCDIELCVNKLVIDLYGFKKHIDTFED